MHFSTKNRFMVSKSVKQNILRTKALDSFLDGYNVSIFAYGTTGTGKTFTIFGTESMPGLLPRICCVTLKQIRDHKEKDVGRTLSISFIEIYREKVYDLLVPQTKQKARIALRIREHPQNGPYVDGLNKVPLRDAATVKWAIDLARANRTQAENNVHSHSSRSHVICTVYYDEVVTKTEWSRDVHCKLQLIDLAGSEKVRGALNAKRFEEGKNINKSLSSLSTVISKLAERSFVNSVDAINTNGNANLGKYGVRSSCYNSFVNNSIPTNDIQSMSTSTRSSYQSLSSPITPAIHIPYRNSKLTWLLSDSLGGNTKTTMIATISPCFDQYNDTLNTLRYAQQAKKILNQPVVNEDASAVYIRKLLEEISTLKQRLHEGHTHMNTELPKIGNHIHRPMDRRRRANSENDVSGSDVQVFNRLMLRQNSKHTQYAPEVDLKRDEIEIPQLSLHPIEAVPSSQGPVLARPFYSKICHETVARNWSPSPRSNESTPINQESKEYADTSSECKNETFGFDGNQSPIEDAANFSKDHSQTEYKYGKCLLFSSFVKPIRENPETLMKETPSCHLNSTKRTFLQPKEIEVLSLRYCSSPISKRYRETRKFRVPRDFYKKSLRSRTKYSFHEWRNKTLWRNISEGYHSAPPVDPSATSIGQANNELTYVNATTLSQEESTSPSEQGAIEEEMQGESFMDVISPSLFHCADNEVDTPVIFLSKQLETVQDKIEQINDVDLQKMVNELIEETVRALCERQPVLPNLKHNPSVYSEDSLNLTTDEIHRSNYVISDYEVDSLQGEVQSHLQPSDSRSSSPISVKSSTENMQPELTEQAKQPNTLVRKPVDRKKKIQYVGFSEEGQSSEEKTESVVISSTMTQANPKFGPTASEGQEIEGNTTDTNFSSLKTESINQSYILPSCTLNVKPSRPATLDNHALDFHQELPVDELHNQQDIPFSPRTVKLTYSCNQATPVVQPEIDITLNKIETALTNGKQGHSNKEPQYTECDSDGVQHMMKDDHSNTVTYYHDLHKVNDPTAGVVLMAQLESGEPMYEGSNSQPQSDAEVQKLILDTIHGLGCFRSDLPIDNEIYQHARPLCAKLLPYLIKQREVLQETLDIDATIVNLKRLIECFDEMLMNPMSSSIQSTLFSRIERVSNSLFLLSKHHEKKMLQTALELLYDPMKWIATPKTSQLVLKDTAVERIFSVLQEIHNTTLPPITSEFYGKLKESDMLLARERIIQMYKCQESSSMFTLTITEAMVVQYLLLERLRALSTERTKTEKQADLYFLNRCTGITNQKAERQQTILSTSSCNAIDENQTVQDIGSVERKNTCELVGDYGATDKSLNQVCCEKLNFIAFADDSDGKQDGFPVIHETEHIAASCEKNNSYSSDEMVCIDPAILDYTVSYLQSKHTENVESLSEHECDQSSLSACLSLTVTKAGVANGTEIAMIPTQTFERLKLFLQSRDDTYASLLYSSLTASQGLTSRPGLVGITTEDIQALTVPSDKTLSFESNTPNNGNHDPVTIKMSALLQSNAAQDTRVSGDLRDFIVTTGGLTGEYDVPEKVDLQSQSSVIITGSRPYHSSQTSNLTSEIDSAISATPIQSPIDKNLGFSQVVASLHCLRLLNKALSGEKQLFDLELKLTQSCLCKVYNQYGEQLTRCEDFQQHWHQFIDSLTASDRTRRKIFRRIEWSLIEWTVTKVEQLPSYLEMIKSDSRTLFQLLDRHETNVPLSNPEMFADIICTKLLSAYFSNSHISLTVLSTSLNIISQLLSSSNTSHILSNDEYVGLRQLIKYDEEPIYDDFPYFNVVELILWKILQWWSSSFSTTSDALQESKGSRFALSLILSVLRAQSKDSLNSSTLCIEAHCTMAIGTFASTGIVEVNNNLLSEWMSPLESSLRQFLDTTSLVSIQDLLRSTTRLLKVNSSEEVDYKELKRLVQCLKHSTFYLEDRLPVQRYNALVSTLDIFNHFICPEHSCDSGLNPEVLRAVALHTIQTLSLPTNDGIDERLKLYVNSLQLRTTLWCAGCRGKPTGGLLLNPNECATLRACVRLFCENKFSPSVTDVWLEGYLSLGCFSTNGWYVDKSTCMRLMALSEEIIMCVKRDVNPSDEDDASQNAIIFERITILDIIFAEKLSLHAWKSLLRVTIISSLFRPCSKELSESDNSSSTDDVSHLRTFVIPNELESLMKLDISEQVVALVQLKLLRSHLTDAWCRDHPMPFTDTFLLVFFLRQLLYRQEFACYLESRNTRHLVTTVFFQIVTDTRQSFPQLLNALVATDVLNLTDLLIDELRRLTVECSLDILANNKYPTTSLDYWRKILAVVVGIMLTTSEKSRKEYCCKYFNKVSSDLFISLPLSQKNTECFLSGAKEFLTSLKSEQIEYNCSNNHRPSLKSMLLKCRQLVMAALQGEVRTPDQAWRLLHHIVLLESWIELAGSNYPTVCVDNVKGHLVCIMVSKSTEFPCYLNTFDRECLQRLAKSTSKMLMSEVNKAIHSASVLLTACDASEAHCSDSRTDCAKQNASTLPATVWSQLEKALSLIVIAKSNLSATDVGEITRILVNVSSLTHSAALPTVDEINFLQNVLNPIDAESHDFPEDTSLTTTRLASLRLIYNAKAKLIAMERNLTEVKPSDMLMVYSGFYSIINTPGIWINLTKRQQHETNEMQLLTLEHFLSEKVTTDISRFSYLLEFMKEFEPIFEIESENLLKVTLENCFVPDRIGGGYCDTFDDTAQLITFEGKMDNITSEIVVFCLKRKLQTRATSLLKLSRLLSIANVLEQLSQPCKTESLLLTTVPAEVTITDALDFIQSDTLSTVDGECDCSEVNSLTDLAAFTYLNAVVDGCPLWPHEASLLSTCIRTILNSTKANLDKATFSTCYKLADSLRQAMYFLDTETITLDRVSLSKLELLSMAYEGIMQQNTERYFGEAVRLAFLPNLATDQERHFKHIIAYICMLVTTRDLNLRDFSDDIKTIWKALSSEKVGLVPSLKNLQVLVQAKRGDQLPSFTTKSNPPISVTPSFKLLLVKYEMDLLLGQLEAKDWTVHHEFGLHFIQILRLCQDILMTMEPKASNKLSLVSHLKRFICHTLLCTLTQTYFILNKREKKLLMTIAENLSLDDHVCCNEPHSVENRHVEKENANMWVLRAILDSDFHHNLSPVQAAFLCSRSLTIQGQMEASVVEKLIQKEVLAHLRRSTSTNKLADSSAKTTFLLLSSLQQLEGILGPVENWCSSDKSLSLNDVVKLVQCLTTLTDSRNCHKQFTSWDGEEHPRLSSQCEAELNSTRFELVSLLSHVADHGAEEKLPRVKLTTKQLQSLQELDHFWRSRVLLDAQRQRTINIRKLSVSAECDLTADMTTAELSTALRLTTLNGQPSSPHDAWVCTSVLQELLNEPGDEYVNISSAQRDTLKSAMCPSRTLSSRFTSFNDCNLMVALCHLVRFSQDLRSERNTETALGKQISSRNVAAVTASLTTILHWVENESLKFAWLKPAWKLEHSLRATTAYGDCYWVDASEVHIIVDMLEELTSRACTWIITELETYFSESHVTLELSTSGRQHLIYLLQCSLALSDPLPTSLFAAVLDIYERLTCPQTITLSCQEIQLLYDLKFQVLRKNLHKTPHDPVNNYEYVTTILQCLKPTENATAEQGGYPFREAIIISTLLDHLINNTSKFPANAVILYAALLHDIFHNRQQRTICWSDIFNSSDSEIMECLQEITGPPKPNQTHQTIAHKNLVYSFFRQAHINIKQGKFLACSSFFYAAGYLMSTSRNEESTSHEALTSCKPSSAILKGDMVLSTIQKVRNSLKGGVGDLNSTIELLESVHFLDYVVTHFKLHTPQAVSLQKYVDLLQKSMDEQYRLKHYETNSNSIDFTELLNLLDELERYNVLAAHKITENKDGAVQEVVIHRPFGVSSSSSNRKFQNCTTSSNICQVQPRGIFRTDQQHVVSLKPAKRDLPKIQGKKNNSEGGLHQGDEMEKRLPVNTQMRNSQNSLDRQSGVPATGDDCERLQAGLELWLNACINGRFCFDSVQAGQLSEALLLAKQNTTADGLQLVDALIGKLSQANVSNEAVEITGPHYMAPVITELLQQTNNLKVKHTGSAFTLQDGQLQHQQPLDAQSTYTDSYRLTALEEEEAVPSEQATLADLAYQPSTAGESLEMFDTTEWIGCSSMKRLYGELNEELLASGSNDKRPSLEFNDVYLESHVNKVSDRIDSVLISLNNFEKTSMVSDAELIKAEQLAEVCALRNEVLSLKNQLIGMVCHLEATGQTQKQNALTASMHRLAKQQQRLAMQYTLNHEHAASLNTDSHYGRLAFKTEGCHDLQRPDRKYQSSDCLQPISYPTADPVLHRPIGTESMNLLPDAGMYNRISSLDRLHELIEIRRAVVAGSREELYRLGVYSSLPPSLKLQRTTQALNNPKETPRPEVLSCLLEKQRSHAHHLMDRANYEHNQSYRVVTTLQQQIQELERHITKKETI